MASDDEDPYVKAGREIAAGKKPPSSDDTDPYVAAGKAIAGTAPALPVTTTATNQPDSGLTWRGTAKEIAAAGSRIGGDVINLLSDPYANLIGYPLTVAGQTIYDFLAPKLGYNQLTPEQRADLYAPFQDQTGTRAVTAIGQNVPGGPPLDPYNTPGTPGEKQIGRVVEGAGAAGLLAPGGPGAVIAGGGGVLGGEALASQVADEFKPAAQFFGSVVAAKAAQMGTNVGTRTVNAIRGKRTPVADAYDELGIDKRLLGDLSENQTARLIQAYGSKSPFGASVVGPVEQKVVGQFNGAVERTAKQLGSSTSEQTAGEILQTEARNWKDVVFPQRETQAWTPVDQLLGSEVVAPTNYRGALTSLTSKLAGLPDTAKALVPAKTWDLLDAINKDVPAGRTMSWRDAQNLRSAIGQVMGVPEIVQSLGKDQLKRAYGGISQDMRDTAALVDARNATTPRPPTAMPPPSAVNAFNNANRVSTEGHAFIEGPLSKIIRSNNPAQETIAPEKATISVLNSGDTTLEAIRREMPKAADELGAYKLRDMALATPGAAGRTGAETSVGTFLTDLNRMRQQNPAGFKALYSDPSVARKIDALATVADTMKETARRANTSGTGPYMALGEAIPTAAATYYATGSPYSAAASLLAPFAANRAAGYVATNPLLARMASAPGPRQPINPLLTGVLLGASR